MIENYQIVTTIMFKLTHIVLKMWCFNRVNHAVIFFFLLCKDNNFFENTKEKH